MRARLVGSYLTLLLLLLLGLEVPLAVEAAAGRARHLAAARLVETTRLATLAGPALDTGEPAALRTELARYHDQSGVPVALVDRYGGVLVTVGEPAPLDAPGARRRVDAALAGRPDAGAEPTWPWGDRPLAIALPITSPDGRLLGAVLTASPTAALRAGVGRVWLGLGVAGLTAGLILTAVAYRAARWILRPVGDLVAAARRISDGALEARVPANPAPPELRELAQAFNATAESLADALSRQRAFVSHASHQLRNPLTALRLRVEELGGFVAADEAAVEGHRLALEETDRLGSILDGLLALARAERGRCDQQVVDAAATADERVAAWLPLAVQRDITLVRTGCERAAVIAVPTAVGQALDALIDNALKFAGSGARVEVSVEPDAATVDIHVRDDGPGLSDEGSQRATERFWRAGGTQNLDGTGLGLPIAVALVEASGGRLDLGRAQPHGLDARLRFPAAG